MFLLWILLALGIGWAFLHVLRDKDRFSVSSSHREAPLDVLKRRYAEGEISAEEYEERKARLEV